MRILVLGLGNELLSDEGVGVHAVRRLQQERISGNVTLLDVGTAILEAVPELERADHVIVIDAMMSEAPPGSIYKADLRECSGSRTIASMHGFDIYRVMALTGRSEMLPTTVFGMEPEQIIWSMELSNVAAEALPRLLDAVMAEMSSIEATAG